MSSTLLARSIGDHTLCELRTGAQLSPSVEQSSIAYAQASSSTFYVATPGRHPLRYVLFFPPSIYARSPFLTFSE